MHCMYVLLSSNVTLGKAQGLPGSFDKTKKEPFTKHRNIIIFTVLPRLVRMRTIKLMRVMFIKNLSNCEQFLQIFGVFEQRNLDLK